MIEKAIFSLSQQMLCSREGHDAVPLNWFQGVHRSSAISNCRLFFIFNDASQAKLFISQIKTAAITMTIPIKRKHIKYLKMPTLIISQLT